MTPARLCDAALRWVAPRLLDCVVSQDTVGQLGGNESAVLRRGGGSATSTVCCGNDIGSLMTSSSMLSVSIGTVGSPNDDDEMSRLWWSVLIQFDECDRAVL